MSEPQDTTRLLAGLLRAHYATAVEKAGWTPGWEDDAERILAALEAAPASRDTLSATEDATCGRLLVGQGDDTYDPACALPRGHSGVCRPDTSGEKPSPSTPAEGPEAAGGPSLDGLDGSERALLDELAGVLRNITRYPHHSHPGVPAVSYMHKPAVLHDRAVTALGLYDRLSPSRGGVR